MRPSLLVDENIAALSVRMLRAAGFDVASVAEHNAGMLDEDVLSWSVRDARWLITMDRDYGELLFRRRLPAPSTLIYLRLPKPLAHEVAERLLPLLSDPEAWVGRYVVVERDGLRKRPLLRLI